MAVKEESFFFLLLLFLLALLCFTVPAVESQTTKSVPTLSATEFLGQYTYFRGWKDKRRLLIIKGDDETMNQTLDDAVYNHRCDLAIRGVNLVLLGRSRATETKFLHTEDNRKDYIQTNELSHTLRYRIYRYLNHLYRDLNYSYYWAILIGYDGGRKRMYRKDVRDENR